MKKSSTYYLALLTVLNMLFGWGLRLAAEIMADTLADVFGARPLPPWTANAIRFPWWPYAIAVLCIIGAVTSLFTGISARKLNNATIALLFIELWLMFITVAAYVIPWFFADVQMS